MADQSRDLAEIGRLGRNAKTRANAFSSKMPCDWNPYVIENPETNLPFNDDSAWQLACNLAEEHPEQFREVILRKPPGCIAYETTVMFPNSVCVYIKVQLFQGKAYGRSFHISIKE